MAQPPLSQMIRRLEDELGVPLLYRTTRRVDLAPAGEVLLDRARHVIASADAAARDARRAALGEVGRLAIGFTGSATYALLPQLATALREQLPGVELELRGELLTPAQVSRLEARTLDLGLLRPPVRHADLVVEVVRSEPLVAVLPRPTRWPPATPFRSRNWLERRSSPIPLTSARSCTTPWRTRAPHTDSGRPSRSRSLRPPRSSASSRPDRRLTRACLRDPAHRRRRGLPAARRRPHPRRARTRLPARRPDAVCSPAH